MADDNKLKVIHPQFADGSSRRTGSWVVIHSQRHGVRRRLAASLVDGYGSRGIMIRPC